MTSKTHRAPSQPVRVACAIVFGVAFGYVTFSLLTQGAPKLQASDFTYPWLAARAIRQGVDPYAYVARSGTPSTPTLFYPFTAGLVVLPVSWLAPQVAAAVFQGVSCAFLAYAITRRHLWALWIFAASPVWESAATGQWSPLLIAAALCSPALGLVVAKPNLALPLLAYQTRRQAIIYAIVGGGTLTAISLLLDPAWPLHWIRTIRDAPVSAQYQIPVFTRWGWPLLLAALRWRTRDGRLVLGMALTSQNYFFYDQLPLFLVARSRQQLVGACVISWVAFYWRPLFHLHSVTTEAINAQLALIVGMGLYLPALIMVLRRPNVFHENVSPSVGVHD